MLTELYRFSYKMGAIITVLCVSEAFSDGNREDCCERMIYFCVFLVVWTYIFFGAWILAPLCIHSGQDPNNKACEYFLNKEVLMYFVMIIEIVPECLCIIGCCFYKYFKEKDKTEYVTVDA